MITVGAERFAGSELTTVHFDVELFTQHWSGCWGGLVPKYPVTDSSLLSRTRAENPWLNRFLNDSMNVGVWIAEKATENRDRKLGGKEFLVKPRLEFDSENSPSIWAVAVMMDGKVLLPIRDSKRKDAVEASISAFRFNTQRHDPHIVFGYTAEGKFLEHVRFAQKGIVAVNFYNLGKPPDIDTPTIDLKSEIPIRAELIFYGS